MDKVDLEQAAALAGRVGDEVSIAMSVLNLYLGYRLELFRAHLYRLGA